MPLVTIKNKTKQKQKRRGVGFQKNTEPNFKGIPPAKAEQFEHSNSNDL